ncbi:hypothetical protein [Butyrivibrio sp. WCE2006]|uniref:hypothetical protein n=1 Tax=Butyrivibrio sp. WCE2006 TaxID=1410611 RepID=UPI000679D6FD|nr:hypothetical protein [Butyrivibrio sp. WCE2006]
MKIKFESIKDDARAKAWYPGSQIREIGNIMSDPNSMALTYGRLQHLFGEPFYTSDDLEDAYDYLILGTDEEGNTYQLTAYHGPTGPAIGGDSHDPQVAKAAEELEKYINEADYVDYDYEGVYHDFDVIVKFGIRDGVPYMEETGMDGEELDYSEFEF